jgi:hypothetical protein
MPDLSPSRVASFEGAWAMVFLSTLASGVCTVWVFALMSNSRTGVFSGTNPLELVFVSALLGAMVAAPIGMVSGTICAPFLTNRPKRAVVWTIAGCSFAGPLSAPFIGLGSALAVVALQVVASLVLFVKFPNTSRQVMAGILCGGCGYSLAGLDRAKTTVCPECGEALPVDGVAPASHARRHPIGEEEG